MSRNIQRPALPVTPEQEAQLNDYVVDRLIIVEMMTCESIDLMQEIIDELTRQGRYRFSLKNTLNNVRRELKELLGDFFNKIDVDGTEQFTESLDILDKEIRAMGGLKDRADIMDPDRPRKTRTQMFQEWWFGNNSRPPMVEDIIKWADTH